VVLIGGVVAGAIGVSRRRERTCEKCGVYMPLLDERADDAHLDEGQVVEEQIGAVDHQVHVCPKCEAVRTFQRVRWFSGYQHCDACGRRTRSSDSVTEIPATQYSTGRVRITETCANCTYSATYTRVTPMLPTPSASHGSGGGGGGGGSFGGGSSGGGGAGSSW
jgi:uncharacterized protein